MDIILGYVYLFHVRQKPHVNILHSLTALEDPSFSIVNDLPFYRYIQGTMMTLLVIYVLWILYYIIRGLSILPELNKYSNKFKVVWGMTLGIIIAAALTFVALNAFGKYNSGIFLLSQYCLPIFHSNCLCCLPNLVQFLHLFVGLFVFTIE